jgi:hypothetical protein
LRRAGSAAARGDSSADLIGCRHHQVHIALQALTKCGPHARPVAFGAVAHVAELNQDTAGDVIDLAENAVESPPRFATVYPR